MNRGKYHPHAMISMTNHVHLSFLTYPFQRTISATRITANPASPDWPSRRTESATPGLIESNSALSSRAARPKCQNGTPGCASRQTVGTSNRNAIVKSTLDTNTASRRILNSPPPRLALGHENAPCVTIKKDPMASFFLATCRRNHTRVKAVVTAAFTSSLLTSIGELSFRIKAQTDIARTTECRAGIA